ncbi:uncharacterized protein HMPREF1541_08334 [Cyphellophora europaea CBS 101466]|uniref:Uncharacterized protein n=1 Tax=Cyphellophora europaea (strain CBS 101466) TaxID=1220924 RepID=W2RNS4_CYPE1|nr:uncharacterized protein HMPREF1541_08334 [Cyphellophora europaea CBS 101466]ETN37343.1 hypothetical protein HMPREF1541_08334 [Cyphellophora europaea CBS 101466]
MNSALVSDRALWLIIPIACAVAAVSFAYPLRDIKEAATAPPIEEQPNARRVDDDAEDHIPVGALKVLSDGHSFHLRNAAFKIALSQSLKDVPKAALLKDLSSKQPERRDQALQALVFLIHGPDASDADFTLTRKQQHLHFQNLATYRALVTALVNLLPFHTHTPTDICFAKGGHPPSPIRPLLRPTNEVTLINLVLELLRSYRRSPIPPEGGLQTFLKAGIVQRWLANYPFPCTLPQYLKLNFRRSDVVELLTDKAYARDDYLMAELVQHLSRYPPAQIELRNAGLATRSSKITERFRSDSIDDSIIFIRENLGPANPLTMGDAGNDGATGWQHFDPPRIDRNGIDLPRPRSSDRSSSEERLRRRHREAIVVADPGQPVSNQNILQRVTSGVAPSRGLNNDDTQHPGQIGRADSEREEVASHLSFSEVSGSATPSSMPSLLSATAANSVDHERARREELERRLGARQISGAEAGLTSDTTNAPQTAGDLLEMALRAREQSRASQPSQGSLDGQ